MLCSHSMMTFVELDESFLHDQTPSYLAMLIFLTATLPIIIIINSLEVDDNDDDVSRPM